MAHYPCSNSYFDFCCHFIRLWKDARSPPVVEAKVGHLVRIVDRAAFSTAKQVIDPFRRITASRATNPLVGAFTMPLLLLSLSLRHDAPGTR